MKNFLKTGACLLAFAVAGVFFQISCSNSDDGARSAAQLGKLLFMKNEGGPELELWVCNYDGSGAAQIPVSLPADVHINNANGKATPKLSPDGQTVFFVTLNYATSKFSLYRCDVDGSNPQEIYAMSNPGGILEAGSAS